MLYPASPGLNGKVALLEIENGNLERGIYLLDSVVQRYAHTSVWMLVCEWRDLGFCRLVWVRYCPLASPTLSSAS